MSRIATIDIGTNTTLLLIAEASGGTITVLEDRAEITRLGRGIGLTWEPSEGSQTLPRWYAAGEAGGLPTRGRGLAQEGIDRTLAVLSGYAVLARVHEAPIFAIGTEALRRAPNAADFLCRAAALLDTPVEVISGEREAALTFLAAKLSFPEAASHTMVVVDIGGGSTEVIVARQGTVDFCRSLPVGSVRLTERHILHDPALAHEMEAVRDEVVSHLAETPFPSETDRPCLVGVAGTVTTLAAMAQDLRSYDPALVHGYRLTMPALDKQVDRLAASTQREREAMAGLDPRRADVILSGALILSEIVRRVGVAEVLVSDRGIRWGLLHEKLGMG
jgi:exopolyphosphatase/guanosine-5'-triphosphate,3'-diphosphate pyrophosphatase